MVTPKHFMIRPKQKKVVAIAIKKPPEILLSGGFGF
jgi:hypothetical protein